MNLINRSLLNHFGIKELGFHATRNWVEYRKDVEDAVLQDQLLVMPGEVGAGKSVLFQAAAENLNTVKFVYVRNYYRERLTISSIINAVIFDLSNEGPKRDLEARSRQFIRIVGTTVTNEHKPFSVCIVIEEAHRLHKNTLRAIKELREAKFAGKSPLFAVVLIGHPQLAELVKHRKEVLWRALTLELNEENGWMKLPERIRFVQNVFGESAITSDAAKTIATVCKEPLEIMKYVYDCMKDARRAGYRQINSDVVRPTLKQLYEASNMSYGEIEKATGIAKSSVYQAINDAKFKNDDTKQKIESALKNYMTELRRSA